MVSQREPLWYRTLRAFVRHTLRVFFRRVEVVGVENVPPSGPLLLAPNHPNTLIDVLLAATVVERRVRFVAKSTLIDVPVFGLLLRMLGAVPIHRQVDGPVDSQKRVANDAVLAGCEQVVAQGGAVLIFPEGRSDQGELKLHKLKTGLARIALGAEQRAPGEVVIVPIALIYEDPTKFRSSVRVEIGAPIQVAPFAAMASGAEDFGPARALTAGVRDALEPEVVHVDDVSNEALVRGLELLYADTIAAEAGGRLAATRALAKAVNTFSVEQPERVEAIKAQMAEYEAALEAAGVSDHAIRQRSFPQASFAEDALFYLAIPLAGWGIINHYLFYQLPRLALQVLQLSMEFDSTVKLVSGVVALFVCYTVQTALFGWWLGPGLALAYLISLPIGGLSALVWLESLEFRNRVRAAAAVRAKLDPNKLVELEGQRAALVRELDKARVTWLSRQIAAAETAFASEE